MSAQKRKISIKKLAIVITPIVLVIALFFLLWPSIHFVEGERVFEKGVAYRAEDFVKKSNGTVTPEEDFLFTDEVGKQEFHYKVKRAFFTRNVTFNYEVVDTTPPQITFKEATIMKDPEQPYSLEEMRENVILDEGTFELETDYDPSYSGFYHVNITAEDDYKNVSTASYEVIVRDNEEPFVFRSGDGARYLVGSEFNINDIISYGDNADPKPVLTTEGTVDTSVPGDYPIHATLTDFFGNKMEWDLTVKVVEEIPGGEPVDNSYPFEQFIEEYKEEGRKLGIDISSWQGDIDFNAVKEAGCEFVIIRIGYSWQGELTIDKKFYQNLEGVQKAGIPFGIYVFVYDNTEEDLISSMDAVFKELGDVKPDLPIVFDWENFGDYQEYEISFQQLNHLYDVFEREVSNRGFESMLYGSKFYLNNVWTHTDTRPVWLAQYNDWPNYTKPYKIWQCTDSGVLDGIPEKVDLDILFTD